MKIDWTKVKEGFTTMDVLKEENKKLKEKIEILKSRLEEYQEYVEINHKEIERLNNIINEITKTIKDDYFKASDYVRKIEQSGKPQGDYPVYYYYNLKKQELTDEYLNKLDELKGSDN